MVCASLQETKTERLLCRKRYVAHDQAKAKSNQGNKKT
jgi:hypothetical protein